MIKNSLEDEPVVCEICNKNLKEKHKLKRHMMIHTGEKPYTCQYCGKTFSLGYNLNTHVRVHTGEKPFKCEIVGCGKTFNQSGNLKTHIKTNHSKETEKIETVGPETMPKNTIERGESLFGKALSNFSRTLDNY